MAYKMAVIGLGEMGSSLLQGMLEKDVITANNLYLFDLDKKRQAEVCDKFNVEESQDDLSAIKNSDVIFLAVKPQQLQKTIAEFRTVLKAEQFIISIAAGVSITTLESYLNEKTAICRVMPNLPAKVGAAVSALAFSGVSKDQKDFALKLFAACGLAVEVEEKQMDAVTGLSGSGPAYCMLMLEAMADGAVQEGLPRSLALEMAAMTMKGAADLVLQTGEHPATIKDKICSPGGTSIVGIEALEKRAFRAAVSEAVHAATAQSKRLNELK